jgi:hypothetical protein
MPFMAADKNEVSLAGSRKQRFDDVCEGEAYARLEEAGPLSYEAMRSSS